MKTLFKLSALTLTVFCTIHAETFLITGGAGFIGRFTTWLATQKGHKVIVIDHNIKKRFPWVTEYFEADYAEEQTLNHIFEKYNIDAVFHFAAYTLVRQSVIKPLDYFNNNLVKTIKLLEVMLKHNVKKLIFSSSRTVYGDAQFLPITEDHPKNPVSPYGRTKLWTEQIFQDLHDAYGLEFVSVRFVNATGALPEYGLGEDHDPETHVLPSLIQKARGNKQFEIYGGDHNTPDGTCIRSYIHVLDIAHALLDAYEYLNNGGESIYVGLGTELKLSVLELVHAVEKFYDKKVNYKVLPKQKGDSPELYTAYSKAKQILGWEPRNTSLDFILKTVDAYEQLKAKLTLR